MVLALLQDGGKCMRKPVNPPFSSDARELLRFCVEAARRLRELEITSATINVKETTNGTQLDLKPGGGAVSEPETDDARYS